MLWPVRTTASTSMPPFRRLGVPTQISETSESPMAWSLDVVAHRRPLPTTSRSSLASPASQRGGSPRFTRAPFAGFPPPPPPLCPPFPGQAAVTPPTSPRPTTLTPIAEPLSTLVFEFVDDLRPRVPRLDQAPTRRADRV